MKQNREDKKTYSAVIDKSKAEALEEKQRKEKNSNTTWLEEKIDEELKK